MTNAKTRFNCLFSIFQLFVNCHYKVVNMYVHACVVRNSWLVLPFCVVTA